MSDDEENDDSRRTKRLEAAFTSAKKSYDALKIQFFNVKEELTLSNETLDQEYERWKKARHHANNVATTAKGGATAAAAAQARFDNAQKKYNVINTESMRLETEFKKKDAEMDQAFQKWANSRKGRLRKSTPACWNRSRKACGEHIDLCSSSSSDEEEVEAEEEDRKLSAVSTAPTTAAATFVSNTDVAADAARRLARKTPASGPLPLAKRQLLKKAPAAAATATTASLASRSLYKDRGDSAAASGQQCTQKRIYPTLRSQQQRCHVSRPPTRESPRKIATTTAVPPATAAAVTPTAHKEDDDVNQAEAQRIRSTPPQPSLPLQRSVGRSRDWLNEPQNMSRLEALGIFAKFGVSSFATSQNTISHLVFNNDWNQLPTRSDETLTLYVGVGAKRKKCAQTLAGMKASVPVFFDYKQRDHAIHYVGHWKPIPARAVEFPKGNYRNVLDKDRCMKLDLVLERFDGDFSAVMDE